MHGERIASHPHFLPTGERILGYTPKTKLAVLSSALTIGLALYWFFALSSPAHALEVPPLKARVSDLARLMPAERAYRLEERLAQFERETGHQIAVLTIPSLEGDSLEDFSIRVAEKWKIGEKGFDNGAILLIVADDRKLRIEVGYGLEGVLPDAIASRIVREVIVPRLRANDPAGGIEAGIEAILKVTRGEPLPESARRTPRSRNELAQALPLLFFVLAAFLFVFLGNLGNRQARSNWTGRRTRSNVWGGPFIGGFGRGGGWSGGGSGGGGFSGGGGGFGGGGASGSW
ncbi:MAG: TPM domain-containing protein [Candidatus Binatia bacterium]